MTVSRPLISGALFASVVALGLVAILWQIRQAPESAPFADTATTSIYTLRTIKGELSTGAYSRFHWNHPGPLLYQVLSPLYALSGRKEVSLKWTMLLFNLVVIAALLMYLHRRSPSLSATTALAFLPLLYFEQRLLFWAWNPVAPLLSLALALALSAGIVAGDVSALPWLLAVVSFLVQAHVGLTPVAGCLTLAAIAAIAWRARTSHSGTDQRAVIRALLISAGVILALWAVPLVHEVRARPGNLTELARFFVAGHDGQTWSQSVDIFANELIAPFTPARELITGAMPTSASWLVRTFAAAELLALACLAVWSRRKGRVFDAAFAWLCLLASMVGLIAIHSIVGDVSDYLVIWIGVIGTLNIAALLAAVRAVNSRRWAIAVFVVAIGLLGAQRLTSKQEAESKDQTVARLASALGVYCDAHHLVRPLLTFDWKDWRAGTGLVLQFYKADRAVAVADDVKYVFGEPFARTGEEPAEFFLMSVDDTAMPAGVVRFEWVSTVGGYRVVQIFRSQT